MKLVVYGTKWIGDAVMSVPAIRELRRLYPDAELTLYSSRWARDIFEDCDFLDRVLTPEPGNGNKGLFYEAGIWKREKFDLAVLFSNSFRAALVSKLGSARARYGYANEGRSLLLTRAFKKPDWKNTRHEIYYYLNLVTELERLESGSETSSSCEPDIRLPVSETRKAAARETLISAGVDLSKTIIGLGDGSQNSEAKRWPAISFAGLNDRLQGELDASVVLLGSEADIEVSEKVSRNSSNPPVLLSGKTSLSEAVAVLAGLDIFVSNDMGLAHISSALGTRCVTIFGPTNPLTTRPLNGNILRREDVDCSPCMLRDCPIDHRCMTRIEIDDVFQQIEAVLKDLS